MPSETSPGSDTDDASTEWSDLAVWRFSADGRQLWSVAYDLGGDGEYADADPDGWVGRYVPPEGL